MPATKPARRRESSKPSQRWIYALAVLQATSLLSGVSAADKCHRFADERKINKLFSDGGPGTKIFLCQGQKYLIHNPIVFTAKDQELATEEYPEDDALKATIVVVGGNRGVAVQGDCRRCARVTISHLIIDGNRSTLGRIPNPDFMASDEIQGLDLKPKHALTHADLGAGTALVLLGNNEGQKVRSCRLMDPRGWTAIQIREGDNLSCTGAIIEDNVIGPAGEEWDEEIDGDSPELSPLGRPLADGLSLACRDSYVLRNTFIDATEASINIYCSPGSLISRNHIIARSRTQMGGILMIDSSPFNGDYFKTRVENNTIEADEGVLMRVAIGLGSAIWSDDTETVLSGGSVTGNRIRGLGMGYGIAAAGLKDFTVVDNESLARHGGRRGERCLVPVEADDPIFDQLSEKEIQDGIVRNPIPQAFLKTGATIEGGDFQEDFVEADFSYLVCLDVDPDDKANLSSIEGSDKQEKQQEAVREEVRQAAPPPRPVAVEKEVSPANTVMDNIFSHSQARMLEVIEDLGAQVEAIKLKHTLERQFAGSGGALINLDRDGAELLSSLGELSERITLLESDRQLMRKSMDDLRQELRLLAKGLDKFEKHESVVLSEVLTIISRHSSDEGGDDALQGEIDGHPVTSKVAWWTPFVYIIGFQLVVLLGGFAWRRWNRRQAKDLKRI